MLQNELCERLAYYSISTNLVQYLIDVRPPPSHPVHGYPCPACDGRQRFIALFSCWCLLSKCCCRTIQSHRSHKSESLQVLGYGIVDANNTVSRMQHLFSSNFC